MFSWPPRLWAAARRHQYLVGALVVGAVVAIYFSPIVRHRASYARIHVVQDTNEPWKPDGPPVEAKRGDHAEYVYPRQTFVHNRFGHGDVPLWNPLTFGGSPFLAETGSRLAYPPYLLLSWLLDPVLFHDVYIVAHVFVAGIAAFALMKTFGVGFAGAVLTGVAWAFSSYGLIFLMLEMYAPVAALLPLAMLLVRRGHDRRSPAALAGAGLVLGLLLLGTSAELALLSFMAVGAYAGALAISRLAAEWRTTHWNHRAAIVAAPILLAGVALAVGATALIPFLELSGRSGRTATSFSFLQEHVPVHPGDFLKSFRAPDHPLPMRALLSQQVFVGTAAAVLAMIALFRRRPGTGLGRTLLIALFAIVATPLARVAYEVVPGLKSLNGFGRSLFLWCFGTAILGGIGLDVVLGALRGRRPSGEDAGSERAVHCRSSRGAPAVAALLAGSVIAGTTWQLLDYGRGHDRFQPRDRRSFLPPTPATEAVHAGLGRGPGRGRMLPLTAVRPDGIVVPTTSGATTMALDLPSAGGYEPVLPERVSDTWRVLRGEPVDSVLTVPLTGTLTAVNFAFVVRTDLLARMGIASVLGPPDLAVDAGWHAVPLEARRLRQSYAGSDGIVLDVVDAVPRATFVTEAVLARSGEDALRRFTAAGFDTRRQVVLEEGPGTAVADAPPPSAVGPAEVTWVADDPDRIRLAVQAPQPGWLVLLDNWDPGWRATVDGRQVAVRKANYSFRAVPVPGGRSTVTFRYRPTSVAVAVPVSALAGLGVAGYLLWSLARSTPLRARSRR